MQRLNVVQDSDDLAEKLKVNKNQLNAWLKKAVEDGLIKKYSRPVRYVALNEARRRAKR